MKFHKDLGFPKVQLPSGVIRLRYGSHALQQAKTRSIDLPATLDTELAELIEMEFQDGALVKLLYRDVYSFAEDICLVISFPRNGEAFVRTLWLNKISDRHETLNYVLYSRPEQDSPGTDRSLESPE